MTDHYLTDDELKMLVAALSCVLGPKMRLVDVVLLRNKLNAILRDRGAAA